MTNENRSADLLCTTDANHQPIAGSVATAAEAVREGCDLRRFSTYMLEGTGLVEETMTLQTTWFFDEQNVGGLQTLRHPVNAALGITRQPSLALWIFGVAARQCSTFVPLDGQPMADATDRWAEVDNDPYGAEGDEYVPKRYQWWARRGWEQICAHDENGNASVGSWKSLHEAANDGCVLKAGIRNLWCGIGPDCEPTPEHEVFVECTTDFSHVDEGFFGSLTQPTFLLKPCVPLVFTAGAYAPGWLVVRSDGNVLRQTMEPVRMKWERVWSRHAVRWFAR